MSRFRVWISIGFALLAISPLSHAAETPVFEWKDGDRVVLVGDTLIERDQKSGYLETLITAQNPEKAITFRNLGWSGDTVRGLSRARFGPPAEGWQHLVDHVNALKPTVLIVGYGMADSFDGEPGLSAFTSGLNALIDATSATKPRLIILSPIAHENLGPPLPDPSAHNRELSRYRDTLKTIAGERKAWFVDLFEATRAIEGIPVPLTDNGIHPNPLGQYVIDAIIAGSLQGRGDHARAGLTVKAPAGTGLDPEHQKFSVRLNRLPPPPLPRGSLGKETQVAMSWALAIPDLKRGRYTLFANDQAVTAADAEGWSRGVHDGFRDDLNQVEALRATINAKNEFYFYRWRPQNETYLLGFRKHEQGNNAREIPLFDPLVAAEEAEIARLKVPVSHEYELKRD